MLNISILQKTSTSKRRLKILFHRNSFFTQSFLHTETTFLKKKKCDKDSNSEHPEYLHRLRRRSVQRQTTYLSTPKQIVKVKVTQNWQSKSEPEFWREKWARIDWQSKLRRNLKGKVGWNWQNKSEAELPKKISGATLKYVYFFHIYRYINIYTSYIHTYIYIYIYINDQLMNIYNNTLNFQLIWPLTSYYISVDMTTDQLLHFWSFQT